MWLLGIVSIIYAIYEIIKEACEPTLPAGTWDNHALYRQDLVNGVSDKQILKYAKEGRYRLENIDE